MGSSRRSDGPGREAPRPSPRCRALAVILRMGCLREARRVVPEYRERLHNQRVGRSQNGFTGRLATLGFNSNRTRAKRLPREGPAAHPARRPRNIPDESVTPSAVLPGGRRLWRCRQQIRGRTQVSQLVSRDGRPWSALPAGEPCGMATCLGHINRGISFLVRDARPCCFAQRFFVFGGCRPASGRTLRRVGRPTSSPAPSASACPRPRQV